MRSLNYVFNQTRDGKNEIKIMKFIKDHPQLKTVRTLTDHLNLIATQTGKQTIADMAERMHTKQELYNTTYTYEDCYNYIHDLFTTKSLKGTLMENKALEYLKINCERYVWETADVYHDTKCNIDIVGCDSDQNIVIGVQVKPLSYKYADAKSHLINDIKINKSNINTYYMYYDKEDKWSW